MAVEHVETPPVFGMLNSQPQPEAIHNWGMFDVRDFFQHLQTSLETWKLCQVPSLFSISIYLNLNPPMFAPCSIPNSLGGIWRRSL